MATEQNHREREMNKCGVTLNAAILTGNNAFELVKPGERPLDLPPSLVSRLMKYRLGPRFRVPGLIKWRCAVPHFDIAVLFPLFRHGWGCLSSSIGPLCSLHTDLSQGTHAGQVGDDGQHRQLIDLLQSAHHQRANRRDRLGPEIGARYAMRNGTPRALSYFRTKTHTGKRCTAHHKWAIDNQCIVALFICGCSIGKGIASGSLGNDTEIRRSNVETIAGDDHEPNP